MAAPVAHVPLDASLARPEERFELFRAGIGVLHDVERLRGYARAFDARLDSWLIGGMFITSGRQGASRVLRSSIRARRDGFEHVTLMHVRTGRVRGRVDRFVMTRRLDLAHAMLRKSPETSGIAGIGYAVGFSSASHFSSAFRRCFGVSPAELRASEKPQTGGALINAYQRWSAAIGAPFNACE